MRQNDPLENAVGRAAVARRVRNAETTILDLHAEIERLRNALDVIAGFGKVPLSSEWEAGLRDIIRAMTDCAQRALDQPTRKQP